MNSKISGRAAALALAVLLLLSTALPALAEASTPLDGDIIYIESAGDLLALARYCTLDTWSQGKTVILRNDISLEGISFSGIPSFGGTFEGGGHTISGLSIDGSVYPAGLFGIVQRDAEIKSLTVSGSVVPSGSADTLGGIVGINHGKLVGCTFQGYVSGASTAGGVAGLNELTGQLINCSFRGAVSGEHYVGGIAGQNTGSLIQCVNHGSINTTEIDVETSLLDANLDLHQLNSAENTPAGTDIGGIAGFSAGLLQSCRNYGDVGYEHMGYNVGGIVGRQSGCLDGCVNTGTVRGRKDVGGIAGQMEPQVTLKYTEAALDSLWDELDILEALMDQALTDADSASDAITLQIDGLNTSVGTAKDATADLSGAMSDWANSNLDQMNDALARVSWTLNQMGPVMDDLEGALRQAEIASDQFSGVLDEIELMGGQGKESSAQLRQALDDLQTASSHGSEAFSRARSAMDDLKNSLGDTEQMWDALQDMALAIADLSQSFSQISGSMVTIGEALDTAYEWLATDPSWKDLRTGLDDVRYALADIAGALAEISSALERIVDNTATSENHSLLNAAMNHLSSAAMRLDDAYTSFSSALNAFRSEDYEEAISQIAMGLDDLQRANSNIITAQREILDIADNINNSSELQTAWRDLRTGLRQLSQGTSAANSAIQTINSALDRIQASSVPEDTVQQVREDLAAIRVALTDVESSTSTISRSIEILDENFDPSLLETAWTEFQTAADSLELCTQALDGAMEQTENALLLLEEAVTHGSAAVELLNQVNGTLGEAVSLLKQAAGHSSDIVKELAEKPAIQFQSVDSSLTERGDALDDALSQVLDQVNSLNGAMSSSSDTLLADLRAVNRQTGAIFDLLQKASDEAKEAESSDHFEDISDQGIYDDLTSGRISNARNTGTVEGDINVAGIVGSMAIEYDFDPEDDLIEDGGRSLDFRYQTVAVVKDSINTGTVTAKKNYAGGIVGRMDLGTVYACQGCGLIESTSGDYVGGIAGLSRAAVRNSFAKCTLSGGSFVGGILGAGEDGGVTQGCYSLVRITSCEQHAGAVSGSEQGEFIGNRFVSDELAGLGRVSYTGKAEPIDYDTLSAVDGLPVPFQVFSLTFMADDTVLKTESFDFGDSFDSSVYPEIPEKEGCFAQWDILELNDLRFDTVVTAVYTPYITALSSEEIRQDGRPVFYAEGSFQDGDRMETQALTVDSTGLEGISNTMFQTRVCTELWRISCPDDGQDVHTLRFLRPDEDGHSQVYLRRNGRWERIEGEEIGRYLAFPVEGDGVEIAVCSVSQVWWVWLFPVVPLLLFCVLWIFRKKRNKKRKAALVPAK